MNISDVPIRSTYRVGKNQKMSSPRLLKVILPDIETKQIILKKAKDLRNVSTCKNVFINPDLTPFQQKIQKDLREELKRRRDAGDRVKIYRGKVVEINQNFQ